MAARLHTQAGGIFWMGAMIRADPPAALLGGAGARSSSFRGLSSLLACSLVLQRVVFWSSEVDCCTNSFTFAGSGRARRRPYTTGLLGVSPTRSGLTGNDVHI